MKPPNFFIVGAPKCGTTALSEYLRTHPNVFFSPDKEPNYLCTDMDDRLRLAHSVDEYLKACFMGANEQHLAVGEGSVSYLSSPTALKNIKEFAPHARIIVMLRRPVEMAYALHSEFLGSLLDDVPEFERAWKLQGERKNGKYIPRTCSMPRVLQYRDMCLLGEQLEYLYSIFSREQVLPILFDDFKSNTPAIYRKVIEFLELPHDGRKDFPAMNENRSLRTSWVFTLTSFLTRWMDKPYQQLKRAMGIKRTGLQSFIGHLNLRKAKRKPLSREMQEVLLDSFRDDIHKLESILTRDLSHWRKIEQ